MEDQLISGAQKVAASSKEAEAGIIAGANLIAKAMLEKLSGFEDRKKRIETEIGNGSRLTRHRFSL